MSNIRRKKTPTTAKKNTTTSGSGNIIEPKDLNDKNDKVIYGFSTLDDKTFKFIYNNDILEKIKSHYECDKENIILQKEQLRQINNNMELLNVLKEGILKEEKPYKAHIGIPEKHFKDLFSGLIQDFDKFPREENKIMVGLRAIEVQIEVYDHLKKLYEGEKNKSTICIKLGNAIIKKNKQLATILLNDLKNIFDELLVINEDILKAGTYTRVEVNEDDERAEESNNEDAYLNCCSEAKECYNFYRVSTTVLINEYYRLCPK